MYGRTNPPKAPFLLFAVVFSLLFVTPAFAGAGAAPFASDRDFGSRELIVRFAPHAELQANAQGVAHLRAGSARVRSLWGMPGYDLVNVPRGSSAESVMSRYTTDPSVLYVEPNLPVSINTTPDDPRFGDLWGLKNTGQSGGTPGADIKATDAWAVTTGDPDVLVAVIDTGVDYEHPDLAPNMWSGLGWSFVEDNADPMDVNGHGTHVAGTIAAVGNDGYGVAGVAWEAQIMALKALGNDGSGWTADIAEAVTYASYHGADIINMSLGGGGYSQTFYDAIAASDAIVVVAAGNSGVNTDSSPSYPASYDLDNIVSVAATNRYDGLASFSNYGAKTVDLGAPGVSVLSAVPGATYTATTVFSDAFDTFDGWSTDYFTYNPWALASSPRVSAPYSAGHAPAGGYAANEESWLDTRSFISLADADRVVVRFKARLDTVSSDGIYLAALPEGGRWTGLAYVHGSTSGKFMTYEIDASVLKGSRALFALGFFSGSTTGGTGVWVDDFTVESLVRDGGADYTNAHAYKSGTSMAAPHVAGVAALLKAHAPDLDSAGLKAAILDSAEPIAALAGKSVTGGRLDAAGALVAVNKEPVALDDAYVAEAGVELSVAAPGVLANDTKGSGSTLSAELVSGVTESTLALAANGSLSYTPPAGFSGEDTFTYRAFDGMAYSNVATVTITVNAPLTHTITATAGTGGTISPAGAITVTHDESQIFTVTPGDGYEVAEVLVDGEPVTLTGGTYTFTNVTADHTIEADFTLKTHTLSYTAGAGGTVVGASPQYVTHGGTSTEVTAVAGEGYEFVQWSDGVASASRTDADVTGDITAQTTFALKTYTITASAGIGGAISPGPVTVEHGQDQTFTVTPDEGYEVATVLVDGDPATLTGGAYTFVNVARGHTIEITFRISNRAPVAVANAYQVLEGTELSVAAPGVLGNDADADADPLTAHLIQDVSAGTLALNVNGGFLYTPAAGFSGIDSFTYKAFDGLAYSDEATVSITVDPQVFPPVIPISGDNRFDTAVAASKQAYPDGLALDGKRTVVIATGMNWPDALGGTSLAGALDGPVLLVNPTSVPDKVMTEITRLKANKAIILGGHGAVSASVEQALKTKLGTGAGIVRRIDGANRYETADKIAREVIKERGVGYEGFAFVATGANFPDALAAAPLAAAKGWPLYLADPRAGLSAASKTAMAGVSDVVILGGTGAVSATTKTYLDTRFPGKVTRLDGSNRYQTAAKIAKYAVDTHSHIWNFVGITTGENFPDALAGGIVQGRAGSVMLLTTPTVLQTDTKNTLVANKSGITTVTFFGGTGAVSASVRTAVGNAIR